ncbi:MAG: hypothetical protein AAGA68_00480 [Pseudomonadota bacterium]
MSRQRSGRWIEAVPANTARAEQRRAQVTTPPAHSIPGDGNPPLGGEDVQPPPVQGERLIEAKPSDAGADDHPVDEDGSASDLDDQAQGHSPDVLCDPSDED